MKLIKAASAAAFAVIMTGALAPAAEAAPLPTNIGAMKAALDDNIVQARYGRGVGFRGGYGGVGYRGVGFRGGYGEIGYRGVGYGGLRYGGLGYRGGYGYRGLGYRGVAAGAIVGGAMADSAYYGGYGGYGGYGYGG